MSIKRYRFCPYHHRFEQDRSGAYVKHSDHIKAARRNHGKCRWTIDEHDGSYDAACGNKHIFIDGTPKENQYKFCPYCGKELINVK